MEDKLNGGKIPRGFAYNLCLITSGGFVLEEKKLIKLWEECICEIFPDDVYVHKVEYDDGIWIYLYSFLGREIVNEYRELLEGLVKEVAELNDTEVNLKFSYADDEDSFYFDGNKR